MTDAWQNDPSASNVVQLNPWDRDAAAPGGPSVATKASIAAQSNPEEGARALKLGKQTGINPSLVATDLPGYDAHAKAEAAKRAVTNPALERYVAGNPMAASVSGDDWTELEQVSQAVLGLTPDRVHAKTQGGLIAAIPEIANMLTTPMGRDKLLDAAKKLPKALYEGIVDFAKTPGEVAAGRINLQTPEGLEKGISFGIGVALGSRDIRTGPVERGKLSTPEQIDAFIAEARGAQTREEIDAFLNSKHAGPPGAMLMITKAGTAADALGKAVEVAQESKTKARDPALFAESVAAHDPGELHIDAGKVAELYQKEGKVPAEGDGLLGFVPDLANKIEAAAATGGEVTIPVADYIAHVDPTVHAGLAADVRLHNDGVTLTEAEEHKKALNKNVNEYDVTGADLAGDENAITRVRLIRDKDGNIEALELPSGIIKVPPVAKGLPTEKLITRTLGGVDTTGTFHGPSKVVARTGVEAYHGTPHDFEQFDLSKIGTGEGAQSYGHGLYFAENKAVGEQYKNNLSTDTATAKINGKPYDPNNVDHVAAYSANQDKNLAETIYNTETYIMQMENEAKKYPEYKEAVDFNKKVLERLKSDKPLPKVDQGQLYKVSINADPTHFLDWDAVLSAHSPDIQARLIELAKKHDLPFNAELNLEQVTGEQFYGHLKDVLATHKKGMPDKNGFYRMDDGREAASKALAEAGIPGIKYLDQGSRPFDGKTLQELKDSIKQTKEDIARETDPDSLQYFKDELKILQASLKNAENPTRNFVVFDDRLVKITEKNGNPVIAAVEAAVEAETSLMELDPRVFMNMLFKDAKALGITEAEFKAYSDKVARAEQYVLDRAVKVNRDKIAQALSADWKRQEAEIRAEVTQAVSETGVFAAEKYLRENKIELGGDNIDLIADELAPLWGFDSGDALRRALTDLETVQAADNRSVRKQRDDFIKSETARLMEERHGHLAEKIAQEAREIALADHTFDVLADEVRILSNAAGVAPPLGRAEMVAWARQRFEASGISDAANLEKLQRAVAKGGREAEKALLKGDYLEAFQAKQRQFLAAVLAKESLRLQPLINWVEGKIDQFTSEQVVPAIDQGYLEQIRDVLASVGVPQNHAPVTQLVPLRDLITESQGQLAVAPWLEINPPKIQDMSVGQFREFTDSLKSMEHVGRQAKKLMSAHGEAELQNVIFDVKKELARFPFVDQPAVPSMIQRAQSFGRYVLGSHLLVERMFDYIDKFDPEGPLTKYIDRPLRDSHRKELELNEKASAMLRDLYQYKDASVLEQIPNNLIPDALDKSGFRKMTRESLRQVMLNMGNRSNMQKLTEGFNVNEMDLRRWVDQHATAKDVAFVNGIWKIFDMLKPEADAMQLRDTGVPVDTIPATASTLRAGQLNGGYYPIVYDKINSDIVGHRAALNPIFDQHYVSAATPNRYTEARTGYTGALDLTGAFLASRIQGMIHDISFREAVRSTNRLISNQEFRTSLAQHWGQEYVELLPGWLKDIANSHNLDDAYAQGLARGISLIRQNVVNTLIGYNPSTVLKHGFTALVLSANRVGGLDLLGAMKELGVKDTVKTAQDLVRRGEAIIPDDVFLQAFRDALDRGERGDNMRQFVLQSSVVMRNRSRQIDDTIRGAIDKLNQLGVLGAFKNLREKNIQYGRFAVAMSDQLSAVPTWYAAYKQAYTSGMAHDDAVFVADKEVSRAHGSNFVGDQPAVTRLGNTPKDEFFKLFTSLFKFYNHFANNNFQFAWDAAEYLRGNGRQEPGANAARISGWTAAVLSVLMVEYAAGAALDKDKKGPFHALMMGAMHLFGGQFIGLREITSGLSHGYGPASGLMGTIWKAGEETVKDIGKATGAKAGLAKNWIRHTVDTIGFATGLATSQMGRTGQFLTRVVQGQERPRNQAEWRQGLRTGSMKARVH